MRTIEQICTRAILSLNFAFRCANEEKFIDGKKRSVRERDHHRKDMLGWLQRAGFYDFYTEEEKAIYNTKIGSKLKKRILNMYVVHETVEPLLWSVGLSNRLAVPYKFVDYYLGGIFEIEPDYSLDKLLTKCKLRDQADIELHRDIAMLWHWRGIEGDGISDTRDVKSALKDIFGAELEKALDAIPFSKGKYPDFLVGKKVFRNLDEDEMDTIRVISRWRQHAYEWILGDEDWDEVETNT